jgi:hypothetical protein
MNFRVIPISEEIADKVRETNKSPQYGHPAHTDLAKGYGPCRLCLETFERGVEERILFTYNAFEGLADLPLPSPIFVHKEKCEPYKVNQFPPALRDLPLIFEAFGENAAILQREKVTESEIENLIEKLFSPANVKYINIRNAEAGCFIARIDRE